MRHLVILGRLSILGSALAVGCGGGMAADDVAGDAYTESYNCATETRADTFSVGLEKAGLTGALDFKLMTADPAPPARGDNTWVIQVNAMANSVVGAPVTGLETGMTITPYMPDHQHGTPIDVVITPMPDAGQYQLSPVNLWMPGLWQTTISVNANGSKDHVVYSFCLSS